MPINFPIKSNTLKYSLATKTKNDKSWLILYKGDTSSPTTTKYLFELQPTETKLTILLKLIQALFHQHSIYEDWNHYCCKLLRVAIGVLKPSYEKNSRDDLAKKLVDFFNRQWKTRAENAVDLSLYPPFFVALYYGEHYTGELYNQAEKTSDLTTSHSRHPQYSMMIATQSGVSRHLRNPTLEQVFKLKSAVIKSQGQFLSSTKKNEHHQAFVNTYKGGKYQQLNQDIFGHSVPDPYIPTTPIPGRALKYATNIGINNIYELPINFSQITANTVIGKLYGYLFGLEELISSIDQGVVIDTLEQHIKANEQIKYRLLCEHEISFVSFINPSNVVLRRLIRKSEFPDVSAANLAKKSKTHFRHISNGVNAEMKDIVAKKGGILVYRDPRGFLSLDIPHEAAEGKLVSRQNTDDRIEIGKIQSFAKTLNQSPVRSVSNLRKSSSDTSIITSAKSHLQKKASGSDFFSSPRLRKTPRTPKKQRSESPFYWSPPPLSPGPLFSDIHSAINQSPSPATKIAGDIAKLTMKDLLAKPTEDNKTPSTSDTDDEAPTLRKS